MTKTKETITLENALNERSRKRREYGCKEVTIGFSHDSLGNEIVDYITMDSLEVFKCYELKVSLSDLKTENALSWYGDYNYLVVSDALYACDPAWGNYIPPYVGILAGPSLSLKREAKKKTISKEQKEMLKNSLLRSVYWKMKEYEDAANVEHLRTLKKTIEDTEKKNALEKQENDRKVWTYDDYEFYYRKNHMLPSFSIESASKEEREQYSKRSKEGYTWIHDTCPHCGKNALCIDGKAIHTDFCPFCGTDLRHLKSH